MEETATQRALKAAPGIINQGFDAFGNVVWEMGKCAVAQVRENPVGVGLVVIAVALLRR